MMMESTAINPSSWLDPLPTFGVVCLSILAIAIWIFLHHSRSEPLRRRLRGASPLIRGLAGTVAVWLSFHSLARFLILATPWPWFLLAAGGAAGVELTLWLYKPEQHATRPVFRPVLPALRLLTILLVLFVLAEPVLERIVDRTYERFVLVLLDQSESMDLSDPQRDVRELLDLASFHGVFEASEHRDAESVDALLESVPPEKREALRNLREETRADTAVSILAGREQGSGLTERLQKDYGLKMVGFASTPYAYASPEEVEADAEQPQSDWRRLTHMSAALDYATEHFSPGQLAGVVVLSDFRDTARSYPVASVENLARQSIPVFPVLLGSRLPRLDIAVTHAEVPESIYKGERVKAEAQLKLFGVPGRHLRVSFLRDGEILEEKTVTVPEEDNHYRTRIEFTDEPEAEGILSYSIQLEELENESVMENNRWDFRTAVSEDRTNVLLIDSRPRWEFRYLRNLFYGRDKSVHLQYVLTEPDCLTPPGENDSEPAPRIAASASRPFGEAEATDLPESREEWRKFDVIILGDVSPEVLSDTHLADIEHCVSERGTALIVIAGPDYMPHKFDPDRLGELLPIIYHQSDRSHFQPPEPSYSLHLTLEGRNHPIMQVVSGASENERIWSRLPDLQWRYDAVTVKPGATVLAYARSAEDEPEGMIQAGSSPAETTRRIRELTEIQQHRNLITYHPFGLGRVLMLNFDRTWRLRYRIGDTLHHRFWGQILTWGAGENLRAGSQFVRLGTDHLSYSPNEPVHVTARVLREDYMPVTDDKISVDIYRGTRLIGSHRLTYRPDSQGMYDTEIGPFTEAGTYRITLKGKIADRILDNGGAPAVETTFTVATSHNPVEWAEFSADPELAGRIAAAGGTEVLTPRTLASLYDQLSSGTESESERADITLWDHWALLLLLIVLLTSEWILRRKGGLI
ncbi:MAG: hypothetical protein WD708_07805 [Kiritimatiellia bacterium]